MSSYLERLKSNSFFKNVATLAAGTIVSQLIVIAASPFLTRIYDVENFGLLSLFSSVSVFFAVLTTGRYELVLTLPNDDKKAKEILKLITFIGLSVSLFYLVAILITSQVSISLRSISLYKSKAILFLPFYTFLMAIYTGLGYWNQRRKKYKRVSYASALQAISTTLFSIVFGLLDYQTLGMILSLVLGMLVSTIYLLNDESLKYNFSLSMDNTIKIAKEFVSFPKYMLLSDLSISATQQFIPIIFSIFFNTTIVGFYALANRLLRLPIIVIVGAISSVFRNDAIDALKKNGDCEALYKSTFKKLAIMSFPIFLLIFLLAPPTFQFVFGIEWKTSGEYSRLLSVMLFTEFLAIPLNSLFYIKGKQREYMNLQLLNAIFAILAIYIGYKAFNDPYMSLILFTLVSTTFNLIFLLKTFKLSKEPA